MEKLTLVRAVDMTTTQNSNKKAQFRDKIDYLKGTIDPSFLLTSLGFSSIHEGNNELRCACAVHGGDNRTGFRFNLETRTWSCFTNKCDETHGKDIVALIMAKNGGTFTDAIHYLEDLVGEVDDYSHKAVSFRRQKDDDMFIKANSLYKKKPSYVSEKHLAQFKNFRSNRFLKDGFTKETLDFFEVGGGYTDSYGNIRDVIPLRNVDRELEAYSLRDIRDELTGDDNDYKYIITPGFNKDKVLYNLCNAKEYCATKPLILVEGFKTVWRLHEHGIHNAVCVMGSSVTRGQINLLCSYAVNGSVLMFDGDVPGIKGAVSSAQQIKEHMPVHTIFMLEEGKDPSDLDKDTLLNYLKDFI